MDPLRPEIVQPEIVANPEIINPSSQTNNFIYSKWQTTPILLQVANNFQVTNNFNLERDLILAEHKTTISNPRPPHSLHLYRPHPPAIRHSSPVSHRPPPALHPALPCEHPPRALLPPRHARARRSSRHSRRLSKSHMQR